MQLKKRKMDVIGLIQMSLLLLILLSSAKGSSAASINQGRRMLQVAGVLHKDVQIPCKAFSPIPGDKGRLILWYKDGSSTPIYSFDARTKNGRHWVDEVVFGDRASFIYDTEKPYLNLRDIQPGDEGVYTCRVDYSKRPTQKNKVKLNVVIPPGSPTFLDETGNPVQGWIGPYDEGSTIEVTCQVVGGKPTPRVTWWKVEELLDGNVEFSENGVYKNTLTIGPLTREHLDAIFVCQTTNSNEVVPLSSGISIRINYKPLSVEIMGDRAPLVATKEESVSCQSIGAIPPANISWWLDGQDLTDQAIFETDPSGDISISTLSFIPQENDTDKLLTCKAQSPVINHEPKEDSWKLEIFYVPKVKINLGAGNPLDIKEGDDILFECNVIANPFIHTITWFHKGMMLTQNRKRGIIMSEQTLMLQGVNRKQAGVYTCGASNGIGEGTSKPFVLDIKYIPVCSVSENKVIGAAKSDDVEMSCLVDASPGEVSFKWFLMGPDAPVDISPNNYSVQDRTSLLLYHIRTEYDYGEFACYAENELGTQVDPCIFTIVPAGKPDTLENCTLTNQTTDTIYISCLPGFDGGLSQHFVAVVQEYNDDKRGDILRNATELDEPVFAIEGLQPGASYLLAMYAENDKGRSDDSILHGFTLPLPPRQRSIPSTHIFPITPILGVLIGVVGALVIVAVVVVVVMKLRANAQSAKGSPRSGRATINTKKGGAHTPLQSSKDAEDGPDVILYPPYEDVDGIPPKLKHANIYETVQCDTSKENSKNSEKDNEDRDDIEYAELQFSNGKSKKANKKGKKANGVIQSTEENTIYASIDHTKTEKHSALITQKQKQQQQQQQQKLQAQQAQQKQQQLKAKQVSDHLDTAAQGEKDDIPLMDAALESSV